MGSQKNTYVTIPDEYLIEPTIPKAKGFDPLDVLEWAVELRKELDVQSINLNKMRTLNEDAKRRNKEAEEEKKWYML